MRHLLYRALLVLTAIGMALTVLAHLSTFLGTWLSLSSPAMALLLLAVLVPAVPAVSAGNDLSRFITGRARSNYWTHTARFAPRWLWILCAIVAAYGAANFSHTIFSLNRGGVPSVIDGRYVLHNHGNVIRELTRDEYAWHETYVARTITGHLLAFHMLGLTVMYSHLRRLSAPEQPTPAM